MNRDKFINIKPFGGMLSPYYDDFGSLHIIDDSPSDLSHSLTMLKSAFMDCSSDNPFQKLGITDKIIFSVMEPEAKNIKRALARVVEDFGDRFDLEYSEIRQDNTSGVAEADAVLTYKPFGIKIPFSEAFME